MIECSEHFRILSLYLCAKYIKFQEYRKGLKRFLIEVSLSTMINELSIHYQFYTNINEVHAYLLR